MGLAHETQIGISNGECSYLGESDQPDRMAQGIRVQRCLRNHA